MIGRRAVIGLSLLSALLFCAFAAQSASAMKGTHSLNTTAYTCVENGKGDFTDAHCDTTGPKPGEEKFAHVAIKTGETTPVQATNKAVTTGTKDSEPATLKSKAFGVSVHIECKEVRNNTANSWIRNVEPAAKQHTLEGTFETEFLECEVKNPQSTRCDVQEPIVSQAKVTGVEGMEGPKLESNAMGLELVGEGAEETFAKIKFTTIAGKEKCVLDNGETFPVRGSLIATNGPETETAQNRKETGATTVFTPKFKMQTLKFGAEPAEFQTIVTPTNSASKTPLALTTAT